MGVGLLFGLIILVGIFISIPFLFFRLYKKGYKKTAIIISVILLFIVIRVTFTNTIDSFLYSKKDLANDLKYVKIKLSDEHKIIKSDISGMPEYFQKTEVLISENDRNRIIKSIENSPDYKFYDDSESSISEYQNQELKNMGCVNYNAYNFFSRTYFEDKDGYVPIKITISIKKNSDTLFLDRTEE